MFKYGYDHGIWKVELYPPKKEIFLMQYPLFHFIFHIFVWNFAQNNMAHTKDNMGLKLLNLPWWAKSCYVLSCLC
jgi:hypothetical protein